MAVINDKERYRELINQQPGRDPNIEYTRRQPGQDPARAGRRVNRSTATGENTAAATAGYNPTKFTYQPMQDRTPAGEQISTDAEGLRGVSQETQERVRGSQDYTQSDRVTQAQQQLQGILDSRPGAYKSKYTDSLDSILQQIQNPEKFDYSFNGDEMFKQYSDLYTQLGRQASLDAMGQAAGMTGGYGNSYAQNAGNQAYNQYLLGLFDQGSNLRNQAFNEWQANRADQYNQLAAVENADQMDYARYRDQMADWQTDRGYWTDAEQNAYNRDYNEFLQNRDYWNQQQQMENADWWNAEQYNETMRQNDANRELQYQQANAQNQLNYDQLAEQQEQFGAQYQENIRQFNENLQESIRQFDENMELNWDKFEEEKRQYDASLTEEQRQYDRNVAIQYINQILERGQMPSAELLVAAGISKADAQKIKAELASAGGGGGSTTTKSSGTKKTTTQLNTTPGDLVKGAASAVSNAINSGIAGLGNAISGAIEAAKKIVNGSSSSSSSRTGTGYTDRVR